MRRSLSSHLCPLALGFALLLGSPALSARPPINPGAVTNPFSELFEQSLKDKKGLMFHLSGNHSLGGVVVKVGEQVVEIRNREYGRILIRLDRIDAVAMN